MFTQADRDALDRGYRAGARSVTFADGRNVQLRDVAEYERLRSLMDADIARAAGQTVQRLRSARHRTGVVR